MLKVSAVIITLNEERIIEKTLRGLYWCDEIIVVDSGSTDQTVEICKKYGCKTFYRKFDGFGPQKRFAVAQTSNHWILSLDADETLSDELVEEIKAKLATEPTETRGFYLPLSLVFLQKVMRYGGEYKRPFLRIFDRRYGNYNENIIHEGIELQGKTETLHHHILHESYYDLNQYFTKFNSYSSAGAMDLWKKGKKTRPWNIYFRFPVEFIRLYFVKGFMLNGYQGFLWSFLGAVYPVIKYAKLEELNRKNGKFDGFAIRQSAAADLQSR